eukprot:8181153-Alexandrium_andersonii.AAC.1
MGRRGASSIEVSWPLLGIRSEDLPEPPVSLLLGGQQQVALHLDGTTALSAADFLRLFASSLDLTQEDDQ